MSALTDAVTAYLDTRRAMGYRLDADERMLRDFAGYADTHTGGRVTVDAALTWATAPEGASAGCVATRLTTVRHFAAYQAVFDPDTQVPPADLLPAPTTRSVPYVYTPAEITGLMAAAERLSPQLRAATFRTLIGLMAATGLRTGEATRLDRDDLDTTDATLLVRDSKNGRSRRIPLHPSTVTALTDYGRQRDELRPDPTGPALLAGDTGSRLTGSAPSATFRRLLSDVGITAPPGRRPPRLYDLRHTFAVTTLIGWHADRVDVQQRLPALSAYLGHLNPNTTYWYLQAVPELMAVVAQRLERHQGRRT